MWLAYVDESGNTGRRLDDPDQPIHWLVAVLAPEQHVLPLTHAVEALVSQHRTDALVPELHGSALFSGVGAWSGVAPAKRVAIYDEALSLLARHDCVVAHASIDKTKLTAGTSPRTTPHLLALQFLVEKLDAYLVGQIDPLRQRALLVADETQEHEAFAIGVVAGMQASGAGIVAGRVVDRVIDTVHFVRSEDNRGVQLADLVCLRSESSQPGKLAADEAGRSGAHAHAAGPCPTAGPHLPGNMARIDARAHPRIPVVGSLTDAPR